MRVKDQTIILLLGITYLTVVMEATKEDSQGTQGRYIKRSGDQTSSQEVTITMWLPSSGYQENPAHD